MRLPAGQAGEGDADSARTGGAALGEMGSGVWEVQPGFCGGSPGARGSFCGLRATRILNVLGACTSVDYQGEELYSLTIVRTTIYGWNAITIT